MKQYLTFLNDILSTGQPKQDRTGTGTISLFGYQMRFNLSQGFPILTSKKIHFKSIVYELLWFLRGDTNIAYLNANGVSIWNEWADHNGNLGPVYGKQWRTWTTPNGENIDQLKTVIQTLNTHPESRRMIVSAWNVGELDQMALAPCHCLFQFYVANHQLSCQLYQRSADAFLGVPFNISSYALLTAMIAQQTNLALGDFIWTGGDCHIYVNHLEQVKTQLQRSVFALPTLSFSRKPADLFSYDYADIVLSNYQHHAPIKAPVAI